MKNRNEQRREKRFFTEDRAIACFNDPSITFPIAHIIDISKGGLSFQYLRTPTSKQDIKEFDLNILFDDEILIEEVPIHIITDDIMIEGHLTMYRCGVKFGDLSQYQNKQLEIFIQNYTIGNA